MAISGTFTANESSDWIGPVRGKCVIACNIPDGSVSLEYRVLGLGSSTARTGQVFDSSSEMPKVFEAYSDAIQYRLTRASHTSDVEYYMGSGQI